MTVIRFEANEEHFITADGAGSITSPVDDSGMHWAEIRMVASYDSMAKHLTKLTQVKSVSGMAVGQSIYPLRNNQPPNEFMMIHVEPGIYDLQQVVELCRNPDGVATLTIK